MGYMNDLQNRIDQEKARAKQKKLEEEVKRAQQAAEKAKASQRDRSSVLLF